MLWHAGFRLFLNPRIAPGNIPSPGHALRFQKTKVRFTHLRNQFLLLTHLLFRAAHICAIIVSSCARAHPARRAFLI